jgi:succinoglycan biosynthesis protein ExoV
MLRIYYYKSEDGNFGDDLNLWLWPKFIENLHPRPVPQPADTPADHEGDNLLIGIGTLLNEKIPNKAQKYVLGAGAGYGPPPRIDARWTILCVRGPRTAEVLGLSSDKAVTDAAMLIRFLGLTQEGGSGAAFMPHHDTAASAAWDEICAIAGLRYIDPRSPVEEVLRAILSSDCLYTEAMHGAIVADALRVPWAAVKMSSRVNDFKWQDWCHSLELNFNPTLVPMIWPSSGPVSLVKRIVKTRLATGAIRRLRHRVRPSLSNDAIFFDRTDKLLNCLENLQRLLDRR